MLEAPHRFAAPPGNDEIPSATIQFIANKAIMSRNRAIL
jgi:hypothetical protein